MIVIVNYGVGNLHSVKKAFEIFDKDVIISDKPWDITRADKIVLPGVGHFRSAICNIKKLGLFEALIEAGKNKPFLGICLGMQLLFSESEEGNTDCGLEQIADLKINPKSKIRNKSEILNPKSEILNPKLKCEGLSMIKGRVVKFPNNLKVPHIGWNTVSFKEHPLFNDIPEKSWFYFVHSYYPVPDEDATIGRTNYGNIDFASVISTDNIIGCQFHPEKSSKIGLKLIENFVRFVMG